MTDVLDTLKGLVGDGNSTQAKPKKKEKEEIIPPSKAERFKLIEGLNKVLNTQFKVDSTIVRMGANVGVQIPSISTNIASLDNDVIQCGGIPRGRIVEIFGPESSGKTSLALHIIAEEQKNTDNLCALIDAEHALDVTYASKLGVNVNELLISQPDSGEQALETAEALIESKAVSLIVIDSVAALVPQAELDGEMGDSAMGLQARLMSQAMRKLRGKANNNGVTLIFINQIREKIGVMFGSPETTTGGRALKFFASLRLDVRRKDVIGDKEHPIGHVLKIKAVKNKVGSPMRETLVDLIYGVGIDKEADLIRYAISLNVIEKAGPWFKFNGVTLGQGEAAVIDVIKNDPKLRSSIYAKLV